MSAQIDQRIVQMRFDNASFEKNVNQSIGTLDKLKQALSFDGVKNNLQNVFNNLTFNTFNNSITETEQKLNVFHELAVGIIRKIGEEITDKLVGGLKNVVMQFNALGQMKSGFEKYESAINSTQTIMATGKYQMDQVEDALSRLQWFADETSYSMNDMTSALSTLTSQGVELEDAVVAAQGIANWAAESGVSATRASSAFYNLGQAISAGALKMQDWKSIQLLSMNTPQFKKISIAAAVAAGTLEDLHNGMYQVVGTSEQLSETQNFEASLSKGWLSSGVLMDTLEDYGKYSDELKKFMNAQKELGVVYGTSQDAMEDFDAYLKEHNVTIIENGRRAYEAGMSYRTWTDVVDATKDAISSAWSRMYTSIFGNLEEAKELWSEVGGFAYDTFAAKIVGIADAFEEWKDLGGRDQLLEGFGHIYNGLAKIKDIASTVFDGMFGEGITAQKLLNISEAFKNIGLAIQQRIILSQDQIANILMPFRELLKLLKTIGAQIKIGFGQGMADVGESNVSIWKKLLDILGGIGAHVANFISRLREAISRTHAFVRIAKELVLTGRELWNTFKNVASVVASFAKGIAKAFGYEIGLDKTNDDVSGLAKTVDFITTLIEKALRGIRSALQIISFYIGGANEDAENMGEIVGSGLVIIWEKAKQVFKFIKDNIPTTAEEWAALPDKLWNKLKEFVKDIPNRFGSITELPGKFRARMNELLADFPGAQEKFNNFCDKIAGMWDWLMQKFEKLKGITDDFGGFLKSIVEDFKNGFETKSLDDAETKIEKIGAVAGDTVDKIKNFLGFGGDANETLNTASQTLDGVADSAEKATEKLGLFDKLAAIPGKLKEGLNQIDWKKIAEGIGLVFSGTVIASIAKLLYGLGALPLGITKMFNSFSGFMNKTGKGVEKFLTSAGTGLTNLSQGAKQLMKGKARKLTADALLEIAIALGILVGVCIILSKQDYDAMIKAASIMLLFMFAIDKIIKNVSNFNTGALAIFGLGIAIIQIVKAVGMMGKMDDTQLGQGLASLAVILMALSKVMAQFNKVKDNGKEFKIGDALLLVAMGKAVQMMMAAVKDMAEAYSVSDNGAILGLVTILATMFSMAFVMRQFEHVDKGVIKGSIGMLILAKAASSIIMSLGVLAEATYNDSTAAVSVIATITIVMLGLLGMLAIFGHSDSMAKRAISTGIAIYLIGSAISKMMKGMAMAMQAAGNISKDPNASTEEKANATWAPVGAMIGALIGIAILVASFKGVSAKTLIASTTMFTSMAISIGIIIGTIALFANALKGADSKFIDSFNMVVGTIMGIFAILTLLMFVMNRNKNITSETTKITASLPLLALSIGLAVLAVAGALKMIENIDAENLGKAALIVGGLMGLMTIIIIVLKNLASNGNEVKGVTGTLLGMAAALVIMSLGCRLLATADAGAIIAAGGALAIIAVALAGVIFILSKTKIGGKKGAGMIALMLGMAAAVFLVAASLRMLVDTDPSKIWAAALAITTLLAAFTVLAVVAALIPGVKESFIVIATAFVTFSVGVLALAASILVLETAAIMFKKICESFGNAGPELEKGIERIKKVMPEFADAFVIFITSLTGGLLETLPILVGQLAVSILESLKALVEIVPDLVYILGMLILGALTGLNLWMEQNEFQIAEQVKKLIENIWNIFLDVIFGLINDISNYVDENFGDQIQAMFGWADGVLSAIGGFFVDAWNTAYNFVANLWEGIKSAGQTLSGWITKKIVRPIGNIVKKIARFFGDIFQAGADVVGKIVDGIGSVFSSIGTKIGEVVDAIFGGLDALFSGEKSIFDIGAAIVDGLINGIKSGFDFIGNTMADLGNTIADAWCDFWGINSPSKKMESYGNYMMEGLGIGIEEGSAGAEVSAAESMDGITRTISNIIDKAKTKLSETFDLSSIFGDGNPLESFTSGISDMFSMENLGLDSIGSSLTDSLKLDELIPSTDSLTEGLGSLDGLYDTESLFDDTNPVITPVMDLSEIQNGTDKMDSMFDSIDASYTPNGTPSYVSTSQKLADDTAYTAQQNQQAKLDSYNNLYKALNNSGADMSTTEFVNTFNISGNSDPHAVAEEVAAVLQNQVEKKKLAWR